MFEASIAYIVSPRPARASGEDPLFLKTGFKVTPGKGQRWCFSLAEC